MDKKKFRITFVSEKKNGSLKKTSFENFMKWGPKGGATFNAVVVVGVVSLLLFRLPMAILWYMNVFQSFLKKLKMIYLLSWFDKIFYLHFFLGTFDACFGPSDVYNGRNRSLSLPFDLLKIFRCEQPHIYSCKRTYSK